MLYLEARTLGRETRASFGGTRSRPLLLKRGVRTILVTELPLDRPVRPTVSTHLCVQPLCKVCQSRSIWQGQSRSIWQDYTVEYPCVRIYVSRTAGAASLCRVAAPGRRVRSSVLQFATRGVAESKDLEPHVNQCFWRTPLRLEGQ